MAPTSEPSNSVSDTCWFFWELYTEVQAAASSAVHELCRKDDRESRGWTISFPQAGVRWRGVLNPRKMVFVGGVGEGFSTGILAAAPSAFSLFGVIEPSLPMRNSSPIGATLPPWEPRVSSCEWDVVCLLFKRAPGFLEGSCLSLADRIPTDFHSLMLCGVFLKVWCSGLVSPAWDWDLTLLKVQLCSWDIPPKSQWYLWKQAQPLLHLCPSYQSWCDFCTFLVIRLLFS